MNSRQCLDLRHGDIVSVWWPNSNSGADCKRAGEYGKAVRWFGCAEILEVET